MNARSDEDAVGYLRADAGRIAKLLVAPGQSVELRLL